MLFWIIYLISSFQNTNDRGILKDESDYFEAQTESRGSIFIIAIVLNCIGFALYLFFGISYGSEHDCLSDFFDVEDEENPFSETLKQYKIYEEEREKIKKEIGKQNALNYLINANVIN